MRLRNCLLPLVSCAAAVAFTAGPAFAQDSKTLGPVLAPPTARQSEGSVLGIPSNKLPPDLSGNPSGASRPAITPVTPEATGRAVARPAPEARAPAEKSPQKAQAPKKGGGEAADRKSFGDWTLECYEPAVGGIPCQVAYRVSSGNGQQVILVVSMAYMPKDKRVDMQVALPLGFALQQGVEVAIGGYKSTLPVNRCTAQGCLVEGAAPAPMVDAMRAEKEGAVEVKTAGGEPIRLRVSLAGFADAADAMTERNKAFAEKHPS